MSGENEPTDPIDPDVPLDADGPRGIRGRRAWRAARAAGSSAADQPDEALSLLKRAWQKLHESETAQAFAAIMDDLEAAIRMVTLRVQGKYHAPAVERIVLLLAGLAYLVSPVDAIPDVLPVVGYVDDAAVLAWILGKLSQEVDDFVEWEAAQGDLDLDLGEGDDGNDSPSVAAGD